MKIIFGSVFYRQKRSNINNLNKILQITDSDYTPQTLLDSKIELLNYINDQSNINGERENMIYLINQKFVEL